MGLPARQIGSIQAVMQPLNLQAYSNIRTQLQDLRFANVKKRSQSVPQKNLPSASSANTSLQ